MKRLMGLILIFVGALALLPSIALSKNVNEISVYVQVGVTESATSSIMAVGFAVDNMKRGSLGRTASKTGPINKMYDFGIRTTRGEKISCGSAKLTQDSLVSLIYNGKTCHIDKIIPMKK